MHIILRKEPKAVLGPSRTGGPVLFPAAPRGDYRRAWHTADTKDVFVLSVEVVFRRERERSIGFRLSIFNREQLSDA